jgi:hypothetical protein
VNFRQIRLSDKKQAISCIEASGSFSCDSSFVNMYVWGNIYQNLICFENGFLFRCGQGPNRFVYKFPLGGGDVSDALKLLEEDAAEHGKIPEFIGLTEENCEIIVKTLPHIPYSFQIMPGASDYIYKASDLAELPGKKYHSKRNFLNRFERLYGSRSEIGGITDRDFEEILEFNKKWCEQNGCVHSRTLFRETCAIKRAFAHYKKLSFEGLWLRVDGEIKAYTFASRLVEGVADVHVEKADTDIIGAYAVINNALAKMLSARYTYINREEDLEIPGLRQAKQSYHPAILLSKYSAKAVK